MGDMGAGGGEQGGESEAMGTVEEVKTNPKSVTGKFL